MAERGNQERTEPATPRKREEARKEGRVPRSTDLTTALSIVGALLTLTLAGPALVTSFRHMMRALHTQSGTLRQLDALVLRDIVGGGIAPVGWAFLVFALSIAAVGVLANLLQVGILITPKNLAPKWNRVSPLQGLSRLYSWQSVGSFFTGVFKLLAVGTIAWFFVGSQMPSFASLSRLKPGELLPHAGGLMTSLGWRIAAAMLVIGLVDYLFQRWRHERELRMSKQEVKDEQKQQEGDPHIKQRIRQLQRQRATQRMMEEVPKSTVVIVNPTHFAIALRYEPDMRAPRVVAKGRDVLARRIRKIAEEHDVPVEHNPPLARGLYRAVEAGQDIPPEFYQAIARVLAVLMRRRESPAIAGGLPHMATEIAPPPMGRGPLNGVPPGNTPNRQGGER